MQTRNQRIYKVTLTGSIVNMVLLVIKFVAGILGHSAAMVADAVHSLNGFKVIELDAGFNGWVKEGQPVTKVRMPPSNQ